MTCERYEKALALHVGGDLPDEEVAPLEQHLAGCPRCQSLFGDLERTLGALRGLAAEPLSERALSAVRARALAVAGASAGSERTARPWMWALAAGVAIVALATAVPWRARPAGQGGSPGVAVVTPVPPTPVEAVATMRPPRGVSRSMESAPPASRSTLSPEDADQLARAVLAVSGIESLSDWPAAVDDRDGRSSAPLVRLTTADPDVVIYWHLDSNGG